MNEELCRLVKNSGFAVIPNVLPTDEINALLAELTHPSLRRSRAGIRHVLGLEAVATAAWDRRLLGLVSPILGDEVVPFHATMFDKSPASNWLVVWHQDTALPIRRRVEMSGWGPWSFKDKVQYAHAPASALELVLALRIHLDDSAPENGPLRILPGTHKHGVLTDDQIREYAESVPAVECVVQRGGVLLMRPLVLHASSKSTSTVPRRVLHIEYASSRFIQDGIELTIT